MAIVKRETDYAFRALARLAQSEEFLSVSTLAEEADVPPVFLRKIMQRLHAAGIVESRQGPFGGYQLALPAKEVNLLDVLETVQGPIVMNECFGEPEVCRRVASCPVRSRLAELQVELNAHLAEISIADIVKQLRPKQKAAR
jgi:Rrf2 family protein